MSDFTLGAIVGILLEAVVAIAIGGTVDMYKKRKQARSRKYRRDCE